MVQPEHLPLELKASETRKSLRGPKRKLDEQNVSKALIRSGWEQSQGSQNPGRGPGDPFTDFWRIDRI